MCLLFAGECNESARDRRSIRDVPALQQVGPCRRIAARLPRLLDLLAKRRFSSLLPECDELKLGSDCLTMLFQIAKKRAPVAVTHRKTQSLPVEIVNRQIMSLLVPHRLDEILDTPQEPVGGTKLLRTLRLEATVADQSGQDLLQFARL